MTEQNDQDREKKVLSLSNRGKLELKKATDASQVRQSFSHGRSKTVTVEVKRKRAAEQKSPSAGGKFSGADNMRSLSEEEREARLKAVRGAIAEQTRRDDAHSAALEAEAEGVEALLAAEEVGQASSSTPPTTPSLRALDPQTRRRLEEEERQQILAQEEAERRETQRRLEADAQRRQQEELQRRRGTYAAAVVANPSATSGGGQTGAQAAGRGGGANTATGGARSSFTPANTGGTRSPAGARNAPGASALPTLDPADIQRVLAKGLGNTLSPRQGAADDEEDEPRRKVGGAGKAGIRQPAVKVSKTDDRRRGKLTVTQVINTDEEGAAVRSRSVAAMRRAHEKQRRQAQQQAQEKILRDVKLPDVITVQELANRMAERAGDVIKSLMKMGVMATINQLIDADTAELVVGEFGHRVMRVSESDVELVLNSNEDRDEDRSARPPVVTIMGHVDHGKTSLLDALRQTDVAAGEAGGITQHIGAYQVQLASGARITFIDTPGHAAFSEMRARGANITDVVVLVVAANDGVMPQTVEAINHAKAAKVPIIVAINKIDLPDARPERVKNELLQHGIVVEELGGETLTVEVSAKARRNLEKLEEAILLQAEILDLRANPNRMAEGTVIEAKLERGRGSVATVLVERGTLKVGDIFVAGAGYGRVRALIDDRGRTVDLAGPGMPVEVLGLNDTPNAGDRLAVLESEAKAREIAEFRQNKERERQATLSKRSSLEQMFSKIKEGETKQFPVIIKGDVQGSIEAISAALGKLAGENKEVAAQVLHAGVGAITESDITLANATGAMVIGFNVRANPQAREMARRDGVEIRYYSIIYNVLDDVKGALEGLLAPTVKENFIGYAEIRQVFEITKVGKVAGCMVTEGLVKRGAKVRLLRDNVVIHEGTLKTLRRFKDEVREVKSGFECGMAFENYEDIRAADMIEAFELQEVAREL
jgi:translation initiation factor IF-2